MPMTSPSRFAARTPEGREQIASRLAATATPVAGALRLLRVFAFALETEAGLPMPAGIVALSPLIDFDGTAKIEAESASQ